MHPPGSLEAILIAKNAIEECATVMMECLHALTPQGNPDYGNQIKAAQAIMDRIEGKCIERQQVMIHKSTDKTDPVKLLRNPATQEAIKRQLKGTPEGMALAKVLMDTVVDA